MEELIALLERYSTIPNEGEDFNDIVKSYDEIIEILKRYSEIKKIVDEFNEAPDVYKGRGDTTDLMLTSFEKVLDIFKET